MKLSAIFRLSGCIFVGFGCLSCSKNLDNDVQAAAGPALFDAKIIEWQSGMHFPAVDHSTFRGSSKLEILNPEKWRGEVVEVLVTSDASELWSTKGLVITFQDKVGSMDEYMVNKSKGGDPESIIMFDTAFRIHEKKEKN